MLISVIIPAYNTEKYIGRCLDSVCSQTYKDIEIIVVDDASTDGTLQIIKEYADKDSRVRIISQPTNKGNGIGRNTAIRDSHGKYIMFVDSDDYIEHNAVELLVDKAKEKYPDFVMYGFRCVRENKKGEKKSKDIIPKFSDDVENPVLFNEYLTFQKNVNVAAWSYFCKRDFLVDNGIFFDESGRYFEDVIFTSSLIYNAQRIGVLPLALYSYFDRKTSITRALSQKTVNDRVEAYVGLKEFLKEKGTFQQYKESYIYCFVHSVFIMPYSDFIRMEEKDGQVYDFLRKLSQADIVRDFYRLQFSAFSIDSEKDDIKDQKHMKSMVYFISRHFDFSVLFYRACFRIGKFLRHEK